MTAASGGMSPEPLEDVGAATASRFNFQFQVTARHCFAMATDSRISWILCEWHADFVVGYADGVEELVSVKHRDLSQGRWTLARLWDDGGLGKLFEVWKHLGSAHQCRLITNAGLEPGAGKAGGFARACNEGSLTNPYVDAAAAALGCNRSQAKTFLACLHIEAEVPDRANARSAFVTTIARPALDQLNLSDASAEEAWDSVVGVVAVRCRDHDGSNIDALSMLADRSSSISPNEMAIRRRRLRRNDVLLAIADARSVRGRDAKPGVLQKMSDRRRAQNFTGRDEALRVLRQAIAPTSSDRPSSTAALIGISGAGKSEIALQYAFECEADAEIIWWIRADNIHTALEDLTSLSLSLGVAPPNGPSGVAPLHDALRTRSALVVADDSRYLPEIIALLPLGACEVLITSTDQRWASLATPVPVDALTKEEAQQYLAKALPGSAQPGLQELARVLDGLPLALEQASAYMVHTGMSASAYVSLLQQQPTSLLTRGATDRHVGFADTLSVALESLTRDSASALLLLRLLAHFADDSFPVELFAMTDLDAEGIEALIAAREEVRRWDADMSLQPLQDPLDLQDSVAALRQFSLVRVGSRGLSLHALTRRVVRDLHSENDREAVAACFALLLRVIDRLDPTDPEHWPAFSQLIGHIDELLSHARIQEDFPQSSLLFHSFASTYLGSAGMREEAARHASRIAELADLSPDPAGALLTSAQAYLQADQFEGGLALAKRALSLDQADSTHRAREATAHNLIGLAYHWMARPAEALAAFDAGIEVAREEHATHASEYDLLDTRLMLSANRANSLSDFGDPNAAVAGLREILRDVASVEGNQEGPRGATVRSNLSLALCSAGKYSEAEKVANAAASIDEALFGPDHVNVSRDLNNRGLARHELGRYAEAHKDFERALHIEEISNSRQTLRCATIRGNMGRAKEKLGDLEGAVRDFEEAAKIQTRLLGPNCRQNALTLNNLSSIVSTQGDHGRAIELARKALEIDESIFGEGHHETAPDMHNIAIQLTHLKLFPAAKKWIRRSLDVSGARLGEDHPMHGYALVHLGVIDAAEGKLPEARLNLERGTSILAATLGEQHPTTREARQVQAHVIAASNFDLTDLVNRLGSTRTSGQHSGF